MPPAARTIPPAVADLDQRVRLHGLSFADYEAILGMRGDHPGPRIAFLDGELELMSPSREHERISEMLGRLLAAFAEERDISFNGYGAWTLKESKDEAGAEADRCYIVGGGDETKQRPDLAVEVVWTHGGLDKLEVYRRLGVAEVWFWKDGRIAVHCLVAGGYELADRSALLPDLDLDRLALFADRRDQVPAVREWRALLRGDSAAGE